MSIIFQIAAGILLANSVTFTLGFIVFYFNARREAKERRAMFDAITKPAPGGFGEAGESP